MGSILLLLIGIGVGAYYGKKYPEKVDASDGIHQKDFQRY